MSLFSALHSGNLRRPAVRPGVRQPRRVPALCLWALAGAVSASGADAAPGNCSAPTLGALAGAERSQWQEFNAQGKSLLREQGTLKAAGLQVAGRCHTVDWSAHWTLARGDRDYDGMTNTGAPFQTHSRLQAQHLALQGWLPVRSGWSLGTQLGYHHIERDIASQGSVLGYPERFGYWQAALGARYQAALGERLQLTVTGWAGGGPGGRVRVELPRADPVTLPLGASRLLALGVALGSPAAALAQPGWTWQLGLAYRHERISAGEPRTLVRNGLPVGAALQPRIVQRHLGTTAGVTYRF